MKGRKHITTQYPCRYPGHKLYSLLSPISSSILGARQMSTSVPHNLLLSPPVQPIHVHSHPILNCQTVPIPEHPIAI